MLSSVLNSERAIQVNIAIMRAFVRMRRMVLSHEELACKVDASKTRWVLPLSSLKNKCLH